MVVPSSSMYSPFSVHDAATALASPFSTTLMKSAVALRTAASSSFVSLGSTAAFAGAVFSCAAARFLPAERTGLVRRATRTTSTPPAPSIHTFVFMGALLSRASRNPSPRPPPRHGEGEKDKALLPLSVSGRGRGEGLLDSLSAG